MSVGLSGGFSLPGFTSARESAENSFLWGQTGNEHFPALFKHAVVDSGAVDAGETPTTDLRPGLVLAQLASGSWTNYDPTKSTQDVAGGIMPVGIRMQDIDGNSIDQYLPIVVGGAVVGSSLYGLDDQGRAQMSQNFIFDDDLYGDPLPFKSTVTKAVDYTVLAADSGKQFITTGAAAAVKFTLPTLSSGLRFRFVNDADQNMTVTTPAGNDMLGFNDLAATNAIFSTAGQKIGAIIEVIGVGSKWVAYILSSNAVTFT